MSDLTLILLAAGASTRFLTAVKKQWIRVGYEPLWQFVANRFDKSINFEQIIIVASNEDVTFMDSMTDFLVIKGGDTRQQSLQNALLHAKTPYTLVSDVARCCINKNVLQELIKHKDSADCIVPALHVNDTIVYDNVTINRNNVLHIQTPQLSKTDILRQALNTKTQYTDESSAVVAFGGSRVFIQGDVDALKLTSTEDIKNLRCLQPPSNTTLIGNGFDIHAFDDKGEMFLGGVKIKNAFGFIAHSDGDVALHALIDALLGAAGLGDIGMLFSDKDKQYENIDSKILLLRTVTKLYSYGFIIINVDLTIIAQIPRLDDYKQKIKTTIASILKIPKARVNIKATTSEKLGFIGRKEGVGVIASASLNYAHL